MCMCKPGSRWYLISNYTLLSCQYTGSVSLFFHFRNCGYYGEKEAAQDKSCGLPGKSFNKNKEYIGQLHDKGITVILYGNPSYKIVDNPEAIKANLYKYVDLIDSDHLSSLN